MNNEVMLKVFKTLSNETRLNILRWLKEPDKYFPPQDIPVADGDGFENAVCVGSITDKAGVSQSVTSQYLDMMQKAGLLESERFGKWTYYRRKEDNIQSIAEWIGSDL